MTTCAIDCAGGAAIGCKGHCGSSSKNSAGATCYCDSQCSKQSPPDCCTDKLTYCP
jgi:hypothetical protein